MNPPRPPRSIPPATPGPAGLYAIVYVSTAVRRLRPDDLAPLLEVSRSRNRAEAITGVLLYADGAFMQYIEGPAAGLSRVYASIKTHPLHYGLVDLVREPIAAREFAEWSMACHVVGAFGAAAPAEQDALLASRLADALQPRSLACGLLARFWARGRASVPLALQEHKIARPRRRALDPDAGTGTNE